jgi:hypothetical protein
MERVKTVCKTLVGNLEKNKSLERPKHKQENNIKINRKEIGCGVMGYIRLV